MKHALETDELSTYDRGFHKKVQQVQRGAFDFCTKFAIAFEASYISSKDPLTMDLAVLSMGVTEYTGKHLDVCFGMRRRWCARWPTCRRCRQNSWRSSGSGRRQFVELGHFLRATNG